jgi:hypothetical protein
MPLDAFYPVLLAEDPTVSARFYTEHMGLGKVFEGDWYVNLKHRQNPAYELAIVPDDHETIPQGYPSKARLRRAPPPRGCLSSTVCRVCSAEAP